MSKLNNGMEGIEWGNVKWKGENEGKIGEVKKRKEMKQSGIMEWNAKTLSP